MSLQNYAKFESNSISNDAIRTSDIWFTPSYQYSDWILDSTVDFISMIIWWIIWIITTILVLFWIFLFLYIVISLISKWWEKTSEDIKKIALWLNNIFKNFFWWFFNKIKNLFLYFWNRKIISISIIILLSLINFGTNIIDWSSKILKLNKINSWYVWVDLKNNKILNPWYHLYSPIKTSFFLSPTSDFAFEIAEVTAQTKEELGVTLDYRVWFKLKNENRLDFYRTYWAKNIQLVSSDIVMPKLLEIIKWTIKNYGFREISSKHNKIKNITITEANEVLIPLWIELQDITILDIRLPKSYLISKEDLLKSENELKLAEAKLEAQKKESEKAILQAENTKKIKIIEAESIAEYNKIINSVKMDKEAIEIKKLEIQKLKIEKWDWKIPTNVWWNFEL